MTTVKLEELSKETLDKLKPALDILSNELFKGIEGICIAGGFIRKLLFGLKIEDSDCDIYIFKRLDYDKFVEKKAPKIKKRPVEQVIFIDGNPVTLAIPPGWENMDKKENPNKPIIKEINGQKCQIIFADSIIGSTIVAGQISNISDVISYFDFTCCCFAVSLTQMAYSDQAFEDAKNRIININKFSNRGFLERLQKYIRKGFIMGDPQDFYYEMNRTFSIGKRLEAKKTYG